jgi:hypothetical protein
LFLAVVCVALLSNGLFEIAFSYREHTDALIRIQREQAEGAAEKIAHFIKEIENQIGWTTQLTWSASTIEQRRFDGLRLLRQVPAITELAHGRSGRRNPARLPARAAGDRGLRPPLGPGRLRRRGASRPAGQERHPQHAPHPGRRAPGPAPAPAREPGVALHLRQRGSPFATAGFARMIQRAAIVAGLELKAHPHMLRHACGYALANKGHDTRAIQGWLGHRSITSTAVYTALAPNRFKDFWRD